MDNEKVSYYQRNKELVKQRMLDRNRLITNSDVHMSSKRSELINDLNTGKQQKIAIKTMLKYSICRDPKTLQYYYNPAIGGSDICDLTCERCSK